MTDEGADELHVPFASVEDLLGRSLVRVHPHNTDDPSTQLLIIHPIIDKKTTTHRLPSPHTCTSTVATNSIVQKMKKVFSDGDSNSGWLIQSQQ